MKLRLPGLVLAFCAALSLLPPPVSADGAETNPPAYEAGTEVLLDTAESGEPSGEPEAPPPRVVVWLDDSGKELNRRDWPNGEQEPAAGKDPSKASDSTNVYFFREWELVSDTDEGRTYQAAFTAIPFYVVVWLKRDGSELDRKTYLAGQTEPTTDKKPANESDDRSTYTFDGWDSGTVSGNVKTYQPKFEVTDKQIRFTVTVASGITNGKVTAVSDAGASVLSARKGSRVTILAVPDEGYEVDTVTATTPAGAKQTLTKRDNGGYAFTMPAVNITVKATFKALPPPEETPAEEEAPADESAAEDASADETSAGEDTEAGDGETPSDENTDEENAAEPAPVSPFEDVPTDSPLCLPVLWAVANGVTNGRTNTLFDPDAACTRGQAVTFLWRAAGSPQPDSLSHPFTDVRDGSFCHTPVLWAVEQGITKGTTVSTFSPNMKITRAQAVTFLYRAALAKARLEGGVAAETVTACNYFDAANWAAECGVVSSPADSDVLPTGLCTRGCLVSFLYRCFAVFGEPDAASAAEETADASDAETAAASDAAGT